MVNSAGLPARTSLPMPACGQPARIMVVEDELLIRIVVSDDLRDAGYEVIEACSGDEALAILESAVHVDLILSDVRMPGSIDGMALLDRVGQMTPGLPVVITSGHLDGCAALSAGACCFVAKPYSRAMIERVVREALAEGR